MKLIDLLKQELPKHGGWPEGVNSLLQGGSGGIYRDGCISASTLLFTIHELADDVSSIVTREQYEAWDGKGLPPAGTVCEVRTSNTHEIFELCEIVYSGEHGVSFVYLDSGVIDCVTKLFSGEYFRPIRTKRDKAVEAMRGMSYCINVGEHYEHCIYDAIAAGKIDGVRLDD